MLIDLARASQNNSYNKYNLYYQSLFNHFSFDLKYDFMLNYNCYLGQMSQLEFTWEVFMIPKIIHYIWLGGNPLPKIAEKCIESWKKMCPDYEIKRWDESNLDLEKYEFCKDALASRKFAFASDVLRTDILYNHGGLYLDIDVEIIKPIDELLEKHDCFMGFETSNLLNPGLIIGTVPKNKDLENILKIYKKTKFDANNLIKLTVCEIFTDYFKTKGLVANNTTQTIETTTFYNSEYFSPIDVITSKKKVTSNTKSIHWYNASWYSPKQNFRKICKKILNVCTFGLFGKWLNKRRNKAKVEIKNEK